MVQGISSALSALQVLGEKINTTANNVANANTTGFKKGSADSSTAPSSTVSGHQVGRGVVLSDISENLSQGAVTSSDSATDLAINGTGYFIVRDPGGGTYYTRDGHFSFDQEGNLTDSTGNVLQGWRIDPETGDTAGSVGDISLNRSPAVTEHGDLTSVTVDKEGVVTGAFSDGTKTELFKVVIARFTNPSGLDAAGNNLYSETRDSGEAVTGAPDTNGLGNIIPLSLEESNVDIVEELTNMKLFQRSYEANLKVIEAENEMKGDLINIKS